MTRPPPRQAALPAEILACTRGDAPPPIALMRLVLAVPDDGEVLRLVAEAAAADPGSPEMSELASLAAAHRGDFGLIRATAGAVDHEGPADGEAAIRRFAASYDNAVRVSPEASVALYSMGDPTRLAAATAEVVDLVAALGPRRAMLDVGCGIGRLATALADRIPRIVGLDISPGMVAEARRRAVGLEGLEILEGSGHDLSRFPAGAFDLVIAVDSMPYLFAAGEPFAARFFQEAARVLAAGGDLLVLNASYRGDPERDRRDVARFAAAAGFDVRRLGDRPFRLWNGAVFHCVRRPG